MPLSLRPGAVAGRTNPMYKEPWLRGRRRTERRYSMFKVRWGWPVRRYPSFKVRSSSCALLEQP